jgi:hypothetical protein
VISARTPSGIKAAAAINLRDAGGALRTAGTIRQRDAVNVLKLIYSAAGGGSFVVAAAPLAAFGARAGGGTTVTSEQVVATVTGGLAPYSYAWSVISAPSGTWTIQSPVSDRTSFVCAGVPDNDSYVANFKCTVTDSRGIAQDSATVEVTCSNYGDLGGILP